MFKCLNSLAEYFLSSFFSLIGFRDPVTEDDHAILPHVKKALEDMPYSGLEIGERLPVQRNWEHAVRYLGDSHVIKYVSPEPMGLMGVWVSELQRQKRLLQKYFSNNLVEFDYVLVPVVLAPRFPNLRGSTNLEGSSSAGCSESDNQEETLRVCASPAEDLAKADRTLRVSEGRAIYVVVMEKVRGRPFYELSDEDIFSNKVLANNLLGFFENNNRLRRDHGIFVDALGGAALTILNPRHTGNLFVTEDNRVIIVDTVLIPPRYIPGQMPDKYRLARFYHLCYNLFVRPFENHFISRLKQTSSISPAGY